MTLLQAYLEGHVMGIVVGLGIGIIIADGEAEKTLMILSGVFYIPLLIWWIYDWQSNDQTETE